MRDDYDDDDDGDDVAGSDGDAVVLHLYTALWLWSRSSPLMRQEHKPKDSAPWKPETRTATYTSAIREKDE